MGRALTAVVDDYSSLYVNPAGLANMTTWELRLPDLIGAGLTPSVFDLKKSISNLGGGDSASDIASSLSTFDGKGVCANLDVAAFGYFSKRLSIAVNPMSFNSCFRVRTPSILFAKLKVRMTVDAGVSVGFAQSALDGRLRFGVALRPLLVRGGMDRTLENTDILNLNGSALNDLVGLGWGFDFDVGMQGDLKPINVSGFAVKPMMGVALQNVVATKFSNSLNAEMQGDVPPLERKLNIGWGASIENLGAFRPLVSFELRDLFVRTDALLEHIAMGVELALRPRSWFSTALRGHFYKGNLGGGFGMKVGPADFEAGTYALNLGRGPGVGVERVMYGQLSLVW